MRSYPTYRIEDFYEKSFRDGGLTYQQFLCLHKMADEAAYDQNVFMAAIHGIDITESGKKSTQEQHQPANGTKFVDKTSAPMMFGDPEKYSHLSDDERKALTQQMLKHWKPMGDTLMEAKKPKYHS